jgi:hypothetical protein
MKVSFHIPIRFLLRYPFVQKVAERRYVRVQLSITSPLRETLHHIYVPIPMGNTCKTSIIGDELVYPEYHPSHVVSTIKQAFLSARSPVKVKEADVLCVGIDEHILRCNVLMHDSQF